MRLLVADDDSDLLSVLGVLLDLRGWAATLVNSGEQALAACAGTTEFDLVVLDVSMGGITGIEAAMALRRQGWSGPILLWTGWADTIDRAPLAEHDLELLSKTQVADLVAHIATLAA